MSVSYAECHGWQDDGQCGACGSVYGGQCRFDRHHDGCARHPRNMTSPISLIAPCQCDEIEAEIAAHLADMEIDSRRNGD